MNVTAGFASSRESDYDSDGWSLNTLTDFNEKNTLVTAGVAGTNDNVKVFYQPAWVDKKNLDLIVGVNQLLDAKTSVVVNFSWGRATGYLNDQYKLVPQKSVEVAPGIFLPFTYAEDPFRRAHPLEPAYASINRAFPEAKGAAGRQLPLLPRHLWHRLRTPCQVTWLQRLGAHVILEGYSLRLYNQSKPPTSTTTNSTTPPSCLPGARPTQPVRSIRPTTACRNCARWTA